MNFFHGTLTLYSLLVPGIDAQRIASPSGIAVHFAAVNKMTFKSANRNVRNRATWTKVLIVRKYKSTKEFGYISSYLEIDLAYSKR